MNVRRKSARAADPEAATRYMYYWLLVSIFFEYARPTGFIPGLNVLPFNSVIPISLLLVSSFSKELRPLKESFGDPVAKWVLIFFGLITFSVLYAEVTLYAYTITITTLGYVILAILILRIATTPERIRGILGTLVVAHLFLLVMNPQAVLNPQERHYIQGGTFLGDGNDFALSICIAVPMAIEVALASKSKMGRIFWWFSCLVLILSLIASSSRGGTLGLVAVGGYLWLRSSRKGLILCAILVIVGIVLAYAPDIYFQRMGTIAHYQDDGSAMGRITAWQSGLRMFADNPIFGVAAGHFPMAFGTTYRPPGVEGIRWMNAHSMYVMVLGELALPGIITYLTLLFGNMRGNTRLRRAIDAQLARKPDAPVPDGGSRLLYLLNGSMLGFVVAGTFLSVAYYPHIFVLTGLMVSARCYLRGYVEAPQEKTGPRGRRLRAGAAALRRKVRPAQPAA